MKADAGTEAAVIKTMNRMVDSYKVRDMEALVACFAPDSDVVMYGTGADEKRVGLEEIRFQAQRDWDQTDSILMVFNETSVSAAGPVAWVASDGGFQIRAGGQEFTAPARLSLVLEERNGDWLVVHAHFSVPPLARRKATRSPHSALPAVGRPGVNCAGSAAAQLLTPVSARIRIWREEGKGPRRWRGPRRGDSAR